MAKHIRDFLFVELDFDGLLYVYIAFFGACASGFSTDEAAKYISPQTLFWLRFTCTVNSATALALKMYRSTTFSENRSKKTGNGGTQFTVNPNPPIKP